MTMDMDYGFCDLSPLAYMYKRIHAVKYVDCILHSDYTHYAFKHRPNCDVTWLVFAHSQCHIRSAE